MTRKVVDFDGVSTTQIAQFLPGTNSGIRMSTGVEVGVVLPVLNAPFRVILAWNPKRIDRVYTGPTTGLPFALREDKTRIQIHSGKNFLSGDENETIRFGWFDVDLCLAQWRSRRLRRLALPRPARLLLRFRLRPRSRYQGRGH